MTRLPPAHAPGPPAVGRPARGEWRIERGQHFWLVASRVLHEAWDRPPSVAEIEPYWRSLVAVNRARLHDPADADLVFAGQTLVVPPPPPAP